MYTALGGSTRGETPFAGWTSVVGATPVEGPFARTGEPARMRCMLPGADLRFIADESVGEALELRVRPVARLTSIRVVLDGKVLLEESLGREAEFERTLDLPRGRGERLLQIGFGSPVSHEGVGRECAWFTKLRLRRGGV